MFYSAELEQHYYGALSGFTGLRCRFQDLQFTLTCGKLSL